MGLAYSLNYSGGWNKMILARTLPGLHNKFKGNLGNLVRLYFKKKWKERQMSSAVVEHLLRMHVAPGVNVQQEKLKFYFKQ